MSHDLRNPAPLVSAAASVAALLMTVALAVTAIWAAVLLSTAKPAPAAKQVELLRVTVQADRRAALAAPDAAASAARLAATAR